MRVLVTGATGFLGGHLVRALLRRGDEVRALGRDAAAGRALADAGAEVVRADLRDPAAVAAACADRHLVYHVGALSAPWGRAADFHAINVGGTAHVLAGCREHRVGRLVYLSSPSVVFDGRDCVEQDEAAPYPRRHLSDYSRTKRLAEDLVRAGGAVAAVVVRPKAIFGPGDTSLLPRTLALARRGRLPQVGSGDNLVDLTYVENVVDALLAAGQAEAAVGKVYTITNGEHVPLWHVLRGVLRRLGLTADLRPLSYRAAYALAVGMELRARVVGGEPLLTRYTTAVLGRTQTYDISAARCDLGYRPRVSVAEGIERTLASLSGGASRA